MGCHIIKIYNKKTCCKIITIFSKKTKQKKNNFILQTNSTKAFVTLKKNMLKYSTICIETMESLITLKKTCQ